jgi:hypothetical protein
VEREREQGGDDDDDDDVHKGLGEGGLKIMTKMINKIYETEEWPMDFTEVSIFALKKKSKAMKCCDLYTTSLIAHTAKLVVRNEEVIH